MNAKFLGSVVTAYTLCSFMGAAVCFGLGAPMSDLNWAAVAVASVLGAASGFMVASYSIDAYDAPSERVSSTFTRWVGSITLGLGVALLVSACVHGFAEYLLNDQQWNSACQEQAGLGVAFPVTGAVAAVCLFGLGCMGKGVRDKIIQNRHYN